MSDTHPNERVLRDFFDRVWNTGDASAVGDFVAPAYTIHSDPGDPWDGQTLDIGGFSNRLVTSRGPFPDLSFEIQDAVATDDRVAVSWIMSGTNTGPMGSLPPTGRPITVAGLTIYYFRDGKLTGHRQVVDRLAVVQQLGMLGAAPPG